MSDRFKKQLLENQSKTKTKSKEPLPLDQYLWPHPMGTYLILQQVETSEKTRGGLYLPDTRTTELPLGKILLLADACKLGFRPGDLVFFSILNGIRVDIPARDPDLGNVSQWGTFIFLREEDVIGHLPCAPAEEAPPTEPTL